MRPAGIVVADPPTGSTGTAAVGGLARGPFVRAGPGVTGRSGAGSGPEAVRPMAIVRAWYSWYLKFRDSPTEMDSRFRGNDGQTATASVKVTCLAEMTSFPRKRESIA